MIGGQVDKIDKIVNTTFKWSGTEQGMTGMQKLSVSAAAVGAAVAAAGVALFRLADQTTQSFAAFEDMSARTGILAGDLHALSIAAEQSGSDFDAITTGLRRMPSFLEDARNGLAAATTTMDALGVSVADFEGMNTEEAFYRMIDALGGMQDETRQAALAQDVFGRGAMALIPLIEEGSGDLRNFAAEARRTGLVLGEDAYEAADKFQDALALMRVQMQSALMEGIQPMLPQLQETAGRLMDIAAQAIPQMLEAMSTAMPIIEAFGQTIGKAAEGWTLLMQMGEGWNPLAGDFGVSFGGVANAQAAGMTMDPGLISREEYRIALGRDRLALEEELAAKQADYTAALAEEADIVAGSGGGGGASTSLLDADRERNELLDYRMQILEKTQNLEEEQAAAAEEAAQALADRIAEKEQAEYDARLERLTTYADLTTQVMGMAWDSLFTDTRQSFGDMLKAMIADLAKSGLLNLIRKGVLGGATGGLGMFF